MSVNFFPNTHLKPSTYNTYNSRMNKWLSLLPSNHATLEFLYTHPNYSITVLRKHLATQNLDTSMHVNSYIKVIMTTAHENSSHFSTLSTDLLQSADKRWKELRQITFEKAYAYRMEQKPAPGQSQLRGSKLKLPDVIAMRDSLPDGSIEKLLLGFYTHIPPVRADYYATQILPFGEIPTSPNYIFHDSTRSHLVITDFKTSNIYHDITHDLPEELHRQLVLSLQMQPRTYLFVNIHGNSFSRNRYSVWSGEQLFKIFKMGLTITMLRHIFISSLDFNSPPASLQEISKKMGHHLTQQMLYKWRDSD